MIWIRIGIGILLLGVSFIAMWKIDKEFNIIKKYFSEGCLGNVNLRTLNLLCWSGWMAFSVFVVITLLLIGGGYV